MKKIYSLSIFTIVFFLSGFTQNKQSLYSQLVYVNEQWQYQTDIDTTVLASREIFPKSEKEMIQQHLQQVEKLLRSRHPKNLTAKQSASRRTNLNTLHKYWQQGLFPINDLHIGRQPYFIDKYGTYCAVGYLMKESSGKKIAQEIHDSQNYSYLLDIQHPQLIKWANNSGLALDELALIQPGYGGETPATLTEMHYNNTGADTDEYIEVRQSTGGLIGMSWVDSIFFYTKQGTLYKKISRTADMQLNPAGYVYYYTFPNGGNFEDSGRIELISSNVWGYGPLLQSIEYNTDSVVVTDHYFPTTSKTYYTAENESTASGNSLTFCGSYNGMWDLQNIPATIGSLNPCTQFPPLPIIMASFNSLLKNGTVQLEWQVETETNNKYFIVENSIDGVHFKSIGQLNAVNSGNTHKYFFTDDKPNYLNHYRLKQVNNDGKILYSKILFVKVDQTNPLKVTYNQTNKTANIALASGKIKTVTIFDMYGRKIKHYVTTEPGLLNISFKETMSGKYLMQVFTSDNHSFSKLLLIP